MFRRKRMRKISQKGLRSPSFGGIYKKIMLDLSWITESLAIGGSFRPTQTAVLRDHGVTAVVDLRGEESDDAHLLAKHHVEFLHLPTIDFSPVSPAALRRGIDFVTAQLTAGRRVLVHCARGIGRSAVLGLCVLVEQGHTPMEALVLAKTRRRVVSPSPSQFQAWAAWLVDRRAESRASWHVPTFDEFKAIAYRHRS
jgi:protein-tyrosine phosphatase